MPEPGTPVPRPRRPRAAEPADAAPQPRPRSNGTPIIADDPEWSRYNRALEELSGARRAILDRPHKRLDFEIAADRERMRQAELLVEVRALGLGYEVTAAEGVVMTLTRLRESRGDLTGELAVRRYGNHLYRARMNVSSGQARETTSRLLGKHPAGAGIDWREVLEQASVGVLDSARAGDPLLTVGDRPPADEAPRVIDPYLPLGPTLLWGPQGSGKSTIAVAVVVALENVTEVLPGWHPRDRRRCLVLDWESSAEEWNDRIRRVAAGVDEDPPSVAYRRCRTPLADMVEELAVDIDRGDIGFLLIDSFEKAAGARDQGSTYEEKAERVFLALDRLARPSLLLDHVGGEDLRAGMGKVVVKSIGSTLKGAWARATYDLKRDPDRSTDERVEQVMHNVKINDGRPLRPYEFAVLYDGERGPIRFEASALASPELLASLPQAEQLRRLLLHGGSRSTKDLAEEMGTTDKQVRAIVSRDKGHRFTRLPDGTIGLTQRSE